MIYRNAILLVAITVASLLAPPTAEAEAVQDAQGELKLADLFPTDRVLRVEITVDEEDWETVRNQTRSLFDLLQEKRKDGAIDSTYTYVPAHVTIDGVEFADVAVRKKGFVGSQSRSRPSLKVKLNYSEKGRSVEGLTHLTLNNNKQDTALVSQFMGYALFNAAGSPAPRCALAEVFVNGVSLGVYSHVESIKKPLVKRVFGDAKGNLYEGTVVDFHVDWGRSFERKFGKSKRGHKRIEELIEVLAADDDRDMERAIGELVDLDAFYKFWALEGLLGFWDGYSGNRNNFFFYLDDTTDLVHFIPWGADGLFAKYGELPTPPGAPISVKTMGLIAHELYQLESGRARYAKTLKGLLDEHWDELALIDEIDRIEEMVAPHVSDAQSGFHEAMDEVRGFIDSRRDEIMGEIADAMPIWGLYPEMPPVLDSESALDPDSIWGLAQSGDIEGMEALVTGGTDLDTRDESGATPLSFAAFAGQSGSTAWLIEQGADLNTTNVEGNTPLFSAAFAGQVEVVQLLIEGGAELDYQNYVGQTALDVASAPWTNEIEGMIELLSGIMQLPLEAEEVRNGRVEAASLLRSHDAKSGSELLESAETLWQCAKSGDVDALRRLLLQEGVEIQGHDPLGITPLSWAALAGELDAVSVLLSSGADVNGTNQDGGTPLHSAAFLGHIDVVELLIDHGVEINKMNAAGDTPYGSVSVAWNGQIEGITKFIASALGLEVDLGEVKEARPKIAELLREHGGKTAAELR